MNIDELEEFFNWFAVDYFAGQALGGMELTTEDNMGLHFWYAPEEIASRAYDIAFAMMAEREKRGIA